MNKKKSIIQTYEENNLNAGTYNNQNNAGEISLLSDTPTDTTALRVN